MSFRIVLVSSRQKRSLTRYVPLKKLCTPIIWTWPKNANGEGNGDSESTNGSNSPFGNHYWLPNVINNHCVLEFIKAIGVVQLLKIKSFIATSRNAIETLIWTALSTMLLYWLKHIAMYQGGARQSCRFIQIEHIHENRTREMTERAVYAIAWTSCWSIIAPYKDMEELLALTTSNSSCSYFI